MNVSIGRFELHQIDKSLVTSPWTNLLCKVNVVTTYKFKSQISTPHVNFGHHFYMHTVSLFINLWHLQSNHHQQCQFIISNANFTNPICYITWTHFRISSEFSFVDPRDWFLYFINIVSSIPLAPLVETSWIRSRWQHWKLFLAMSPDWLSLSAPSSKSLSGSLAQFDKSLFTQNR